MNTEATILVLSMLNEMQTTQSWRGETHIQKCMYLAEKLENIDVPSIEFIMYKHGPYSFSLHDQIGLMEFGRLITRKATLPYGSRLSITDLGKSILERASLDSEKHAAIRRIATAFSESSVMDLERLATAAYVEAEGHRDFEGKVNRFLDLKPHVDRDSAIQSFGLLSEYPSILMSANSDL